MIAFPFSLAQSFRGAFHPEYQTCLLTQVHTPVLIQLPEVRVTQVADKPDGFARGFHFWSELFVYAWEFIEAEHGFFDSKSFELFLESEIFQSVCAYHDLGCDIQVWDLVSLGNKWRST